MNNFCVIRVTKKCNHNCLFCFLHDLNVNENETPIEEIVTKISDDVKKIYITGGEPFMRKDLPLLLSKIKEKNNKIEITMQTNGTSHLFKEYEEIHKNIDSYFFSIHTLNKEAFKKLSGNNSEKAIETILNNIKYLNNIGKTIHSNTCLPIKGNHLIETLEQIVDLPITHYNLSFLIGYKNIRHDYKNLYQSWTEIDFEKINNIFTEKNKNFTFEGFPRCVLPKHTKISNKIEKHQSIENFLGEEKNTSIEPVFCGSNKKIYLNECKTCSCFGNCCGFEKDYFDIFGYRDIKFLIEKNK